MLLLYSCRKVDYMEKGTFIYLNKSGHTIVMTFFEKNVKDESAKDLFGKYIKECYRMLNFVSNYYKLRAEKRRVKVVVLPPSVPFTSRGTVTEKLNARVPTSVIITRGTNRTGSLRT